MLDLEKLKNRYQKSMYRNDTKTKNLDSVDFMAFLWQLETCQFEITPYCNKGFLRYFAIGMELPIDIINTYFDKRTEVQDFLLKN
jgi:hypothetical protein